MKTWPDTDGSIINHYLSQLRLRCPTTPIYYRQALRSFQEVVSQHQFSLSQVSRDDLKAWLRIGLSQRSCIAPVSSTASLTSWYGRN
jgi:integrase/recombinase XerD